MAEGCDLETVRGLDIHSKAIPWKIETEIYMVKDLLVQFKENATGYSTACYIVGILLMCVLPHNCYSKSRVVKI